MAATTCRRVTSWWRRNDWVYLTLFPQETEIDNIHQLVVGATENIKEGNEDIREVGTWGSQI